MARARLYCTFLLLLYSQGIYAQQTLANNQNIAGNNAIGLQQQTLQRTPNNINQVPNGGLNINYAQQPNLQAANLQQSLSTSMQGNLQQSLPPNLQQQSNQPQNNLQITKIGFTPVSQMNGNPSASTMQLQSAGVKPNVQVIKSQVQNVPISNSPVSQIANGPISTSTLAELFASKGQSPLLSLLNPQNNCPSQQNQQIVMPNTIPNQNQLTEAQKQFLVRSLQSQPSGQNYQGYNLVQSPQRIANVENQQTISVHTIQGPPQQAQAIVTPLGNQPPYITVQAQPLTNYVQPQSPQVVVEEEPSILSLILSELGPQYTVNSAFPPPKKGSKMNLKTLIPLIINILKEKKGCGCQNCGCPPNNCQNNVGPNTMNNPLEQEIAQIFGGYSNQKMYGQGLEDSAANTKKREDDQSKNNDKEKESKNPKKNKVKFDSEEYYSDEDDSEYTDDGDE